MRQPVLCSMCNREAKFVLKSHCKLKPYCSIHYILIIRKRKSNKDSEVKSNEAI